MEVTLGTPLRSRLLKTITPTPTQLNTTQNAGATWYGKGTRAVPTQQRPLQVTRWGINWGWWGGRALTLLTGWLQQLLSHTPSYSSSTPPQGERGACTSHTYQVILPVHMFGCSHSAKVDIAIISHYINSTQVIVQTHTVTVSKLPIIGMYLLSA